MTHLLLFLAVTNLLKSLVICRVWNDKDREIVNWEAEVLI
ncbi:hypothetical protein GXM_08104 [Nostoc sphaeroides CCNUC1]|uniref:Uncharacterized protein n=1 Tax=Nostoc sphaeroides CCNUC1 TaxID=2653204 RepID=A0A5P8WDB4_9NOSO|nr:hypothetical protein GXM_08104 [Nostoc sphaeroides CCNUC1]